MLTVTGESTRCTLLSSMSISRALAHSAFTSCSGMISHRFSCSICRSRSLLESYILDIWNATMTAVAAAVVQAGLVAHTWGRVGVNYYYRGRGLTVRNNNNNNSSGENRDPRGQTSTGIFPAEAGGVGYSPALPDGRPRYVKSAGGGGVDALSSVSRTAKRPLSNLWRARACVLKTSFSGSGTTTRDRGGRESDEGEKKEKNTGLKSLV